MELCNMYPLVSRCFSLFITFMRFIRVVLSVVDTFSSPSQSPLYEYVIIWPRVDGHSCCFQVWAVENKTAMSVCYKSLRECRFSFFLGKYLRVERLGPMVIGC